MLQANEKVTPKSCSPTMFFRKAPLFSKVTPKSCLRGFPACHRDHCSAHLIDVVSKCSYGHSSGLQLLLPCLAHSFPPSLLPSFFCLPCIRTFCSTTNRSQHQLFYKIMCAKFPKSGGIHGDSLKRPSTRGGNASYTKLTGSGSGRLKHPRLDPSPIPGKASLFCYGIYIGDYIRE